MIKLTLECQECGNKVELLSNQLGQQIQMSKLRDSKFAIQSMDVEKHGELSDYDDISDVKTNINSIRIDCRNCDYSYVVLEDFQL